MKIRIDFVTNSSSSSFLIAHGKELTEAQKEAIIQFAVDHLLGDKEITLDDLDEIYNEKNKQKVHDMLEKGYSVSQGWVSFEDGGTEKLRSLYQNFWKAMQKADPENFKGIDTSLYY